MGQAGSAVSPVRAKRGRATGRGLDDARTNRFEAVARQSRLPRSGGRCSAFISPDKIDTSGQVSRRTLGCNEPGLLVIPRCLRGACGRHSIGPDGRPRALGVRARASAATVPLPPSQAGAAPGRQAQTPSGVKE